MRKIRIARTAWDPIKTLECGQFFHWYEKSGRYTVVYGNEACEVYIEGEETVFLLEDGASENKWRSFLQLDTVRDIEKYREDERLVESIEYGEGLVLLKQEPFLCIVSFILSANNHFKRIQRGVQELAYHFGDDIRPGIHAFPKPEMLASLEPSAIRERANAGYRDRYIVETAKLIADGIWDLELPFTLPTDLARKKLIELPGVGPKVADCILLFAYEKGDTFPVDVWMHRIMLELYWEREATKKEVFEDAIRRFGADAGYLQQLLFYYSKSHKIGTGKSTREKG